MGRHLNYLPRNYIGGAARERDVVEFRLNNWHAAYFFLSQPSPLFLTTSVFTHGGGEKSGRRMMAGAGTGEGCGWQRTPPATDLPRCSARGDPSSR